MKRSHWRITKDAGRWTAEFVSANGSVIATTRAYSTRASAIYGITAISGRVERVPFGRLRVKPHDWYIPVLEREVRP